MLDISRHCTESFDTNGSRVAEWAKLAKGGLLRQNANRDLMRKTRKGSTVEVYQGLVPFWDSTSEKQTKDVECMRSLFGIKDNNEQKRYINKSRF